MCGNESPWHKFSAVVLVMLLLMPLLIACGDDGGISTSVSTPEPTVNAPATSTATATPTTKEPVKIGAITSWSGPSGLAGLMAEQVMALVKDQVEEMGGILGGRSLEFIKYDEGGQVANVIGGWKKLVLEEDVVAVVFGGGTSATITASSDAAEEFEVPLFNFSPLPWDVTNRPYTVRCSYSKSALTGKVYSYIMEELKPRTIALLCEEEQSMREQIGPFKELMDSAGIKIVYEQYVPLGTIDFSSHITRIRHANPDVLIGYLSLVDRYITIFKQVEEQGGWGDIKFISPSAASGNPSITKMPGAEGTYHWVVWVPGLSYPGAQKFEQDFVEKYGRLPAPQHAFFYFALWGAIHAIELADSDDPREIAAAARSGKLRWESPSGPLTIFPDGETDLLGHLALVAGGELVPVW